MMTPTQNTTTHHDATTPLVVAKTAMAITIHDPVTRALPNVVKRPPAH